MSKYNVSFVVTLTTTESNVTHDLLIVHVLLSKRGLVLNNSCENELNLHVIEISFSYELARVGTHFE